MSTMMALGMIAMLAVTAAVVVGVVWLSRALRDRRRPAVTTDTDDPREILRRRYAAGEIDEDEYFRRDSGLDQP